MKVKLITIDFWNTLFNSESADLRNYNRNKVLIDTLTDMGISINQSKFNGIIQKSWEYYSDRWINEYRTPSAKEILNFIWSKMGFEKNEKALKYIIDFYENAIILFPPDLEPGANEAIIKLSSKYQLGIVSDTGFSPGYMVDKLLIDLDIRKYFSAFSYSDETGVAKPHPKSFTTILEQLNIKPEEAVHIGDIDRTDIAGAKAIGMSAIRYDGSIDKNIFHSNNVSNADFIANNWYEIIEYFEVK
jgi:putative hydrolase of the HAD superfamily